MILVHSEIFGQLELGQYCVIGGFPCRVRIIHPFPPGKSGHTRCLITGIGVLDQKIHQCTLIPGSPAHVPMVVEETIVDSETEASVGGEALPTVSWEDTTYLPPDKVWWGEEELAFYVITTTCIKTEAIREDHRSRQVKTKAVWIMRKRQPGYKGDTCYPCLLRERRAFLERERREGFRAFLCTTKDQQKNASAVLGNMEVHSVMKNVFGFAYGPEGYIHGYEDGTFLRSTKNQKNISNVLENVELQDFMDIIFGFAFCPPKYFRNDEGGSN